MLPLQLPKTPEGEIRYWSVSELTAQIRGILEPSFQGIWVCGEVANCRPVASGHLYFTLKDASASLSVAAFGWGSRKKQFEIKDGLKVACRGRISVFSPRGNYQFLLDRVELMGAGSAQLALDQLKQRLRVAGLFSDERKRVLPPFPTRIAVVTSPTGAVVQDILTILKRRAPWIQVVVIPALVQGEEAPQQLIQGIQKANELQLGELILLARGGGSSEDLWCFHDEGLAWAIAQSALPVISAVGHEVDFTIADFVADLRAPTPSAAAEILSHAWFTAQQNLGEVLTNLRGAMERILVHRQNLFQQWAMRLVSPQDRLREQMQRLDEDWQRLERAIRICLERQRNQFQQSVGRLHALSPLKVLERGYALVQNGGLVVRSVHQLELGDTLDITFYDGKRSVRVL